MPLRRHPSIPLELSSEKQYLAVNVYGNTWFVYMQEKEISSFFSTTPTIGSVEWNPSTLSLSWKMRHTQGGVSVSEETFSTLCAMFEDILRTEGEILKKHRDKSLPFLAEIRDTEAFLLTPGTQPLMNVSTRILHNQLALMRYLQKR